MLLCRSRSVGRSGPVWRRAYGGDDRASDEALEAANNLGSPVSLGFACADVIEGRLTAAHRRDDDKVKGSVSLPIAPRLRRCLFAIPLDAGIGQAPPNFANAAKFASLWGGCAPVYHRRGSASTRPRLSLSRAPGPSPERASRSVYRGVQHDPRSPRRAPANAGPSRPS